MTPAEGGEPRKSCIDAAAEFVAAQPEGPERALARHRRQPDGNCAGCLNAPTAWPCTTATVAELAQRRTTPPASTVTPPPLPTTAKARQIAQAGDPATGVVRRRTTKWPRP